MVQEIRGLEDIHTWDIKPLLPDKKVLGYKWVYLVKYTVDG